MKELEESLSVELIKRSTRQLVTTQAGQLLYDKFAPLLPDIASLCEEVQNLAEEQQGEIKLSSTPLFARQYLTKIVAEYMTQHPQVNFKIFIEAGDLILSMSILHFVPVRVIRASQSKTRYWLSVACYGSLCICVLPNTTWSSMERLKTRKSSANIVACMLVRWWAGIVGASSIRGM